MTVAYQLGNVPLTKILSQLLSQNREGVSVGVFSEDIYDRVKQLAKACPVKAIIIEKIE